MILKDHIKDVSSIVIKGIIIMLTHDKKIRELNVRYKGFIAIIYWAK